MGKWIILIASIVMMCVQAQHDHSRHIDKKQIMKIADDVAGWTFEEWKKERAAEERAVTSLESHYAQIIERDGEQAIPKWKSQWQKRYDDAVESLMVMSLACQKIHNKDGCKISSNIWNWGKLGERSAQFKAEFLNEINGYLRKAYSQKRSDL